MAMNPYRELFGNELKYILKIFTVTHCILLI